MIKRLLSAPLVQFLLLGVALLWLKATLGLSATPAPPPSIIIDEAALEALRDSWVLQRGDLPTLSQQRYLLKLEVEDQMLLREARLRHFDQLPVVQRRLQQLGGFLRGDNNEALSESERYKLAKDLGLEYSDPLIRTYMINAMRERIAETVVYNEPGSEEIAAYFNSNNTEFLKPRRVAIAHLYCGGLHKAARQRCTTLRSQLPAEADAHSLASAVALGDPFYGGHHIPMSNAAQLSNKFGAEFAAAVMAETVNQWSAPIASAYGYHLVWIKAEQASKLPALDEVRGDIVQQLRRQKQQQAVEDEIARLLANYRVETPVI